MNGELQNLYDFIVGKKHHEYRKDFSAVLSDDFAAGGLSPTQRMCERFVKLCEEETPVILPGERIAMTRTIRKPPDIFTSGEWAELKKKRLHEAGFVCNISPGYDEVIAKGLDFYKQKADSRLAGGSLTDSQREFYKAVTADITAIYGLCERYRAEAEKAGNRVVADNFQKLPRRGADSFLEALQMFRVLHFMMWLEGEYHNTIGRFDQFMYPYFAADLKNGVLTEEDAYELICEFFLSFNRDSDLYAGVQQGDNGQSLVLGGVDKDGTPCFNKLSELCLRASRELLLIDPKINLRVGSYTPIETYELGTQLTKAGLGFPQYSNDDVVIPGLTAKGYSLEDARNYVVAACWEFIIPRWGMDVPNIDALSYPKIVDRCLRHDLCGAGDFEGFMDSVKRGIAERCEEMARGTDNLYILPAPYMSIFMCDCIDTGSDISRGGRYNNYGFHGTGLATAADSLAAIKKVVFDDKTVTAEELIQAVDADFVGYDELLEKLRYETPKIGNNDDYVDSLARELMSCFADCLEGKENSRGGCFRAGTGSAMYYLWHADEIGASPDGRKKGEPFGANYAPSLFAKINGPLSVVMSFTKPDLKRLINGGPLTMEFHDSLFRDDESIGKVAGLVKFFIESGGHQFQLNAINRDRLLAAQANPDQYSGLIVRIWGWSAYFTELDVEYQNHVIRRQEYAY